MPVLITSEPADSPLVYRLPPRQSFRLLACAAVFDGSSFNSDYVPTLEVLAPDGWQMFVFGQDLLVTQHGVVFVTFAPNMSATQGKIPATTAYAQTGMPELDYGPGVSLVFGVRDAASAGLGSAGNVASLSLYVEPLTGDGHGLAYGPFMLVPGPGA